MEPDLYFQPQTYTLPRWQFCPTHNVITTLLLCWNYEFHKQIRLFVVKYFFSSHKLLNINSKAVKCKVGNFNIIAIKKKKTNNN